MVMKYLIELGLIYAVAGYVWTPWAFLSPFLATRTSVIPSGESWLLSALVGLSLPFLWIGLSMSVRRALDAGFSPGLGLLFLFPGLNYLMMVGFSILPSDHSTSENYEQTSTSAIRAALLGVLSSALLGLGMVYFSVVLLKDYGGTLFAATPAMLGAVSSGIFNEGQRKSLWATLGVAVLSVMIAGGAILLFAFEGIICLSMAAPLAMIMAMVGAIIIWLFAPIAWGRRAQPVSMGLLPVVMLLPVGATVEALHVRWSPEEGVRKSYVMGDVALRDERLRVVETSLVIAASPHEVWPHVVGFSDLPPPSDWFFEAGISYPMRARIEGEGVGAVRYCEFSTGSFVEPITVWSPPGKAGTNGRLAFDVIAQPPPMHELSPYQSIHPPHLDRFLRSRRGEFRLIDLGNGHTQLEGRTWYAIDIYPSMYWGIWSDALIHAIHERVLNHIQQLAEG